MIETNFSRNRRNVAKIGDNSNKDDEQLNDSGFQNQQCDGLKYSKPMFQESFEGIRKNTRPKPT